ncbi:MAG: hypothetical protein GDA35_04745 [Hyphomonadaceae bacterium]|nr:hypothetical protein [Hyphomonadaceae bacterium]
MLTQLAFAYFALAIGYNVFSQISLDRIGKKFASTEPAYGLQVMSLVLVIFALRTVIPFWVFLPLFTLWTLSIIRFGIGNHLAGYDPETYLSKFTWICALAINIFGAVIFVSYIVASLHVHLV